MVIQRLIGSIQEAILGRPKRVLAVSILLALVAVALGTQVEFRTSRNDLAPPDDPEQQRFEALVREFGGSSDLIVTLEAAPGATVTSARLREAADALAAQLKADPQVSQVFHRVDLDWILDRGLYLADPRAVLSIVRAATDQMAVVDSLSGVRSFADMDDAIATRLENAFNGDTAAPPEGAGDGIRALAKLLDAERRFLEDPEGMLSSLRIDGSTPPLLALAGDRPELASRGYLSTRDGSVLYLLVSPASSDDSLPALRSLIAGARRRGEIVTSTRPDVRVSFTGEPATTVEEMNIVRRDTWFTSVIAATGVTLLTLLVFRWKSHALLVLAALAVGIAWSFGAVELELGYLNLITSSFISTLVGVGVAYGIHPVSEYELEGAHTVNPDRTVRDSYHRTAAAISTGAVTTAAAFFSILLMNFRGFSELGLVAGMGVLLCLTASLVTLPALLVLYGRRRHRRDRKPRDGAAGAMVDKVWGEKLSRLVCASPRTVTIVALLLTAALAVGARGVQFNQNILEMLPRDAESVKQQERMILESNLSPAFTIAVADDLDTLRAMRERAAAERTISRFESVLDFLPADTDASRDAVSQLGALLDRITLPAATAPVDRPALVRALTRLEAALAEASEAAFGAGLGDLAGPLEEARGGAESALRAAESAAPGMEARWDDGQRRLLAFAHETLAALRRAAATPPPTLRTIPAEMRQRLLTRDGRFLAFASRRVSPDSTGFPIMFHLMTRRITSGFVRAVAVGSCLVFLILLADYRNLRETLMALTPLVIGVIWMLGAMRVLGISYNFANLIAVPLIIGVGIDNGVHVVHRMRFEGRDGMAVVLRHTGRAILIAGLTTMIGFGSLALASHRGLASLGMVLLIGVGSCVTTAMVVLPNMLVAFGLARR